MGDFGITPTRGERQEGASQSRLHHEEGEYMEKVRQGVAVGVYVEDPRRRHVDIAGKMYVAAVGTHGGRQWLPQLSSWQAFMVSKAGDTALWEDLKNIWPPMYDESPLKIDQFW